MTMSVHIEVLLTASAAIMLVGYHIAHFLRLRQRPQKTAMGRANQTRRLWVATVMRERRDILAVRYYNNVGFMINVPVTEDPMSHPETVARILNRGAMHYNLGTRAYYLSIPIALWLLGPAWLLVSAIVMTAALYCLDRPG